MKVKVPVAKGHQLNFPALQGHRWWYTAHLYNAQQTQNLAVEQQWRD